MQSRLAAASVIGALILSTGHAHAIVVRHDVDDTAYLSFANSNFGSVGRMIFEDGGSQFWNGSGTLVGSQWVLTAAHVVDNAPDTDWFFDTGSGTQRVRADAVHYHPDWFGGGSSNGDMALVRLSEPILGVDPTQIHQGATPHGTEVALAGYGGTGDGLTGWDGSYDILRRAGSNMLEGPGAFGFSEEYLMFDFDNPDLGGATDLEAMLMFGDSGGAVMADIEGEWQIIGVNTFIVPFADDVLDYGMYGDYMGSTSVEYHLDWINSIVPAPWGVTSFGLGILMFGRRRRV